MLKIIMENIILNIKYNENATIDVLGPSGCWKRIQSPVFRKNLYDFGLGSRMDFPACLMIRDKVGYCN